MLPGAPQGLQALEPFLHAPANGFQHDVLCQHNNPSSPGPARLRLLLSRDIWRLRSSRSTEALQKHGRIFSQKAPRLRESPERPLCTGRRLTFSGHLSPWKRICSFPWLSLPLGLFRVVFLAAEAAEYHVAGLNQTAVLAAVAPFYYHLTHPLIITCVPFGRPG